MLKYAVCQIAGKQYKVLPGKPFEVDFLGEDVKKVEAQILLLADDKELKVGKPYLRDNLNLEVMENILGEKIRVSKFHAKANYRRVRGFRAKRTKIILSV